MFWTLASLFVEDGDVVLKAPLTCDILIILFDGRNGPKKRLRSVNLKLNLKQLSYSSLESATPWHLIDGLGVVEDRRIHKLKSDGLITTIRQELVGRRPRQVRY